MVAATCWTGGSEGRADATEATAGETVLFDEKKPGTTTGQLIVGYGTTPPEKNEPPNGAPIQTELHDGNQVVP